jgi:3-oxoacyl-[acyl-carrier-protein] synthase II
MRTSNPTSAVVISGLGPMCPLAIDVPTLAALATGADRSGPGADWFQPEVYFGKRGFKYLMPAARYAAAAAQRALADAGLTPETYSARDRGVFVGTNFGGAAVIAGFDEVILRSGASSLSPMTAPNFSINLLASPISERHAMTAFNVTLTNPVVAGLEAVILGARAIKAGQAAMVAAGATEDASPVPGDTLGGLPIGEGGACLVVLESGKAVAERGGKAYATLGEGTLRFFPPAAAETAAGAAQLASRLRRDLQRLVPDCPRRLRLCSQGTPCSAGRRVEKILAELLRERGIEVAVHRCVGDAANLMTVSPMLQLAGIAAIHGEGLVLAASPMGHIALLRLTRDASA